MQAATASSGISQAPPWTISAGRIAPRIVREPEAFYVVTAAKEKLNQEIEKKEQQPDREKYGAAIDAAAGLSSQMAHKSGGRSFPSQFFTKPMTSSGNSVAYYAAANRAEFVVHPNRNIQTIGPQEHRAASKRQVTENSEEA